MKQKIGIIISSVALMLAPVMTYAVDTPATQGQNAGTAAATLQAQKQTSLQKRGEEEISRRITSLNALVTKINGLEKLTAAEKISFTSEIQTDITDLTSLNAKIAADTDLNTLKTDVQSIVNDYRVYLLFMPKIHLLASADRATDTINVLAGLASNLSNRIDAAKTAGKDVTNLQSTLNEMNSKLTEATTEVTAIQNTVTPLTPDGYPANRATLVSARADLKVARTDLQVAYNDAKTIIAGLKAQ